MNRAPTPDNYAAALDRHFARTRRFWLAYQKATVQQTATPAMLDYANILQHKTRIAYRLFNASLT